MNEILQNLYISIEAKGIENHLLTLCRKILFLIKENSANMVDALIQLFKILLGHFAKAEGYQYNSYHFVFDSLAILIRNLQTDQKKLQTLNDKLFMQLYELCKTRDSNHLSFVF